MKQGLGTLRRSDATVSRTVDWILVGMLAPLWFYNVASAVFNPELQVAFFVDPLPSDKYPTVRGFREGAAASASQIQIGDRILGIAGQDARGLGQTALLVQVVGAHHDATASSDDPYVVFGIERAGEQQLVRERFVTSSRSSWPLQSLVYGFAALLILSRAPPSEGSRALFHALLAYSVLYSATPGASQVQATIAIATFVIAILFTQPLLVRAFMSFPQEASMLQGIHRWWPWSFALVGALVSSGRYGFPFRPDQISLASQIGVLLYILTLVLVLSRNYRHSTPTGKRQIKWVLYGVYLGSVTALCVYALLGAAPYDPPWWWSVGITFSACSFPVAVVIAVLRFDMLDINRVIGITAIYNLMLVVLIAVVFVGAPRVALAASEIIGIDPVTGQVVFALLLAAILLSIARYLRPRLDRFLFKERFALEQGIQGLSERLVMARTPEDLWQAVGSDLDRLLRPSCCVIYTLVDESFLPVFARGRSVPPAISKDSRFLAWLASLKSATSLRSSVVPRLDPLDRAFLDSLQARAVVPIFRNEYFETVLFLGEKRSGDIYTNSEIALLTSMSNNLSIHLLRFGQAELIERTRATQDAMRKYVPGAIAEEIARGSQLTEGEREVSVLFVDIRGYTAYAITRDSEAIFSTVNKYTECVSRIVRAHGGSVVEFNGDGMMAVFGAPNEIPNKEDAAVKAGRALTEEVSRLAGDTEQESLNVGVGIATGPAFVGNIKAVDRLIWSAIGNTTNLAARLQNLTRDLNAAIVIDAATRVAAASADDFVARSAKIRGRKDIDDLFLLPMAEAIREEQKQPGLLPAL